MNLSGLPYTNITNVAEDAEGRIWIGMKKGAAFYSQQHNEWRYFYGQRWLPGNATLSVSLHSLHCEYVALILVILTSHVEQFKFGVSYE